MFWGVSVPIKTTLFVCSTSLKKRLMLVNFSRMFYSHTKIIPHFLTRIQPHQSTLNHSLMSIMTVLMYKSTTKSLINLKMIWKCKEKYGMPLTNWTVLTKKVFLELIPISIQMVPYSKNFLILDLIVVTLTNNRFGHSKTRTDLSLILHGWVNLSSNIFSNGKMKDWIVQLLKIITTIRDTSMMFLLDLKKNINMLLIDLDTLNSLELLWIDSLSLKKIYIILHI